MSRPAVVLLDHEMAHLCVDDAVTSHPWSTLAIDVLVERLSVQAPGVRAVRLVVGGAWLDVATPSAPPVSLPPMAPALRRRVLHFQAERLFALPAPVATGFCDEFVVAVEASRLSAWREHVARWAPVRDVLSLPQAVRLAGVDGRRHAPAGPGEHLALDIQHGRLSELRRTRGAPPAESRPLDVPAVLRVLAAVDAIASPDQLLDLAGEAALAARARRAWWRAGTMAAAMALACAWALDLRRERTLDATRTQLAALERAAAPALVARERLRRADEEAEQVRRTGARAHRADAPSQVLARLGALLPADAFVQRLEWDGAQWRIDGSAGDVAALVPRLDADPAIEDVRTLAPSTRFVDNGRPRSSFAIGFRVNATAARAATGPGGARGGE